MKVRIKRVYEKPEKDDGYRILVDRLWPRGMSKEKAKIDLWLKEIAPSDSLRKWFTHDPKKWEEFQERYFKELREKSDLIEELRSKKSDITLVYGAKDIEHNNAVALKKYLS